MAHVSSLHATRFVERIVSECRFLSQQVSVHGNSPVCRPMARWMAHQSCGGGQMALATPTSWTYLGAGHLGEVRERGWSSWHWRCWNGARRRRLSSHAQRQGP